MSPQTMEVNTLVNQLNDCISEMKRETKPHGACSAHWPIHTALRLLLECQSAILKERAEERAAREKEKKQARAETISIAIAVAGVMGGIIELIWKR